jgi:hypothetical protein
MRLCIMEETIKEVRLKYVALFPALQKLRGHDFHIAYLAPRLAA